MVFLVSLNLMQHALDMRAVTPGKIARTSTQNPAPVTVPMMRMPLRFEPVMMSPPPPPMHLPPPPPMQLPPPQHFVGGMPSVPQYVQQHYVPNGDGGHGFLGSNPNDDLVGVRGINYEDYNFNHDLVEFLMRSLDLNSDHEDHYEEDFYYYQPADQVDLVPADERTIFLTFSRGYPISETEVRDFFTRKFGDDLIEAIIKQDVRFPDDQPLYARLVVRSLSAVDFVLQGRGRVKFSIDGKDIWARRCVRLDNIVM